MFYCVLQFIFVRIIFFRLLSVVVYLHMCAFVVLDLVYRYYAKRLAWKNVSKMTCFVSINQVKCEFNGDFAILLTDAAGTKRYNSAGAWT